MAIARAFAHSPSVVLADEPTASLDPINANCVMSLFAELAEKMKVTLIVATHDWDRLSGYGFTKKNIEVEKKEGRGVCGVVVS